jgi:hypothetical protein
MRAADAAAVVFDMVRVSPATRPEEADMHRQVISSARTVVLSAGFLSGVWAAATAEAQPAARIRRPTIADTIRANVYADNWFMLSINGELIAVDSIAFIPHNVISVDILPSYPMTIAVMAKDNADPKTGMEYANTNIGDGGFILKFGDGTVTDGSWKAKAFSHGPVDGDTRNPRVETTPIPDHWYADDFDDSDWDRAKEYSEQDIDPKQSFYAADFKGAKFIWTSDLLLDNTVLFRRTIPKPPDGRQRADFTNLTNTVPDGPPKPGSGRGPRNRPPETRLPGSTPR